MNPLEQLKDIQLPDEVTWWPLATGYWILIGLLVLALSAVIVFLLKRLKHRKALKDAIIQVQNLDIADKAFALKLQSLLKNTIQHYCQENTIKHKVLIAHGHDWQKLLFLGPFYKHNSNGARHLYHVHQSIYNHQMPLESGVDYKAFAVQFLKNDYPFQHLASIDHRLKDEKETSSDGLGGRANV